MRLRLREAYDEPRLKAIYKQPHQHAQWADHRLRVAISISMGRFLLPDRGASICDLSAGDGTIARGITGMDRVHRSPILGDFAWDPHFQHQGPIEQTIDDIEPCRLFVCTETVEHLDNPDEVLRKIRGKAERLLLSTPIGEYEPHNPEHYWGWDEEGVRDMLAGSGWGRILTFATVQCWHPVAHYGIWGCE